MNKNRSPKMTVKIVRRKIQVNLAVKRRYHANVAQGETRIDRQRASVARIRARRILKEARCSGKNANQKKLRGIFRKQCRQTES
jgi:hypothetical protein